MQSQILSCKAGYEGAVKEAKKVFVLMVRPFLSAVGPVYILQGQGGIRQRKHCGNKFGEWGWGVKSEAEE